MEKDAHSAMLQSHLSSRTFSLWIIILFVTGGGLSELKDTGLTHKHRVKALESVFLAF